MSSNLLRFVPVFLLLLILPGCVEYAPSGGSGSGSAAGTRDDTKGLSKHDVALRFLTAYIRLDRNMALRFASPQAVAKLDWNVPHRGNIPYYDDKMLLQFNGGWARVFFEDTGSSFRISDFEVHRR